jgi:hypothetical protein
VSLDAAAVELLGALAPVLGRLKARWYVFGAQAVNVWGTPRLSADVDATVQWNGNPSALIRELESAGLPGRIPLDDEFIRATRVLPLIHPKTKMPLDLVLAGPGPEEEFLDRAVSADVGGIVVPLISPEDLVVTKILAGRPKDVEDVRGILRKRRNELDLTRIRASLKNLEEGLGQSDLLRLFEQEIRAVP